MKITRKRLATIIHQTVISERKNVLPYIQAGKGEEEALRYSVLQQEAMLARVVGTQKNAWARMHDSTVSVLPGVPEWIKTFGASVRNLEFPMGLTTRSVEQIPNFNKSFKKLSYNNNLNYNKNAVPPGFYFSSQSWNGQVALTHKHIKQDYIKKVLSNSAWGNTSRGDVCEYAAAGLLLMAKQDAIFIGRTDTASGRDIDSNIGNMHFEVKSSEDSSITDTLGSGSSQDSTEKYFVFATTEGTYVIRADLLNFYLNINEIPEQLDDMLEFEIELATILFTEKAFSDAIRWQTTDSDLPNPSIKDIDEKINKISANADLSLYLKRSIQNSAKRTLGKRPMSRVYDQNPDKIIDIFVSSVIDDLFDKDILKNAASMTAMHKLYLIQHFSYLQRLLGHHKSNEAYASPEYQTALGKGSRGKAESSAGNVPAIDKFSAIAGSSPEDIDYQISYLLAVAESPASKASEFKQALSFVSKNLANLTAEHKDTIITNALLNKNTVLYTLVSNSDPVFKSVLDKYYVHETGIFQLISSEVYQQKAIPDDYISATPVQGTARNNARDIEILEATDLYTDFETKLLNIFKAIDFDNVLSGPQYDPETYEIYSESKIYESILRELMKYSK